MKGGNIVEELYDCKLDMMLWAWTILVKWRDLFELENSWEQLTILVEDVLVIVRTYVYKLENYQATTRQSSLQSNEKLCHFRGSEIP